MGIVKTLSLITLFVLLSFKVSAANVYLGGGGSFSGVISSTDYYNGANSFIPALNLGVRYNSLGIDTFIRKGTLTNEHQGFDIDLDTTQFGFMFRFSPDEWMDLNLGAHWTTVEGSSSVYNGQKLTGLINRTVTSALFGVGFNFPITERFRFRTDFNYYLGKEVLSLLQFDISLVYSVITF